MNKKTRKIVYEKYGGRCAYCGWPIEMKDMQVDHIVPIARGHSDALMKAENMARGTENIDNYNPACRACNFRKGMLDIEEFRDVIVKGMDVLERNFTYRIVRKYRLIAEVKPSIVQFYFELVEKGMV